MAVRPYIYDGALLTAAATTQGEIVPVLTRRIIKAASLTNTTGAPIAATVHMVAVGDTADTSNTRIAALPIAAGESYPCPELINKGINPGGFVQALGDGLTFDYTAVDFV